MTNAEIGRSGSWVEISRSALLHNLHVIRRLVGRRVAVMPIIKSNAYGHGMVAVANCLRQSVQWFGVTHAAEGLTLRQAGFQQRILVLSYVQPALLNEAIGANLELPVYDFQDAQEIARAARQVRSSAFIQLKVDTGMSRLGVSTSAAADVARQIVKLKGIKFTGIFSHFANGDDVLVARNQLMQFQKVLDELTRRNIQIPVRHIAASTGIISAPTAYFDLVRCGILIYGLWPSRQTREQARRQFPSFRLKPVLTWKARIISVKSIPAGARVGYGGTFRARRRMRIAVLSVGYAEGYDRGLSNRGVVIIGGQRCPVIGRVSMSLLTVDVTRVRGAQVGDQAIIIGRQGSAEITVEDTADILKTIPYEIVTRIAEQIPRVVIQ